MREQLSASRPLHHDQATRVQLADEPARSPRVDRRGRLHRARRDPRDGAEHRKLDVPGETELQGGRQLLRDLRRRVLQEHEAVIIGGGDSQWRRRCSLRSSRRSPVVNRRDEFRASRIMLERARAVENIEFLTPTSSRSCWRARRRAR